MLRQFYGKMMGAAVSMIILGGAVSEAEEPKEKDESGSLKIFTEDPDNRENKWRYYFQTARGWYFDYLNYKSPDTTQGQEDGKQQNIASSKEDGSSEYVQLTLPSPDDVTNTWVSFGEYTEIFAHFYLLDEENSYTENYKTRVYLRPELDANNNPVSPSLIHVEGVSFTD